MLISIFMSNSNAQDNCQTAIIEATNQFDNGNYQKVIDLLETKIDVCDYSKDVKTQIYKMLITSYIEIDDIEKADKLTYYFVKKNPEYRTSNIDPYPFVNSLNSFNIRRNWVVGVDGSITKTNIKVINQYKLTEDFDNYSSEYKSRTSLILNLYFEKYFSKRFSILFDITNYNLKISKSVYYGDFYEYIYKETGLVVKLSNKFSYTIFDNNKISASLLLGYYAYAYTNPFFTVEYKYLGEDNTYEQKIPIEKRHFGNVGYSSGVKFSYRLERFDINLQIAQNYDFIIFNDKNFRYYDLNPIVDYYLIDDDFKIQQSVLLIGFSYNIFYKIKHKYR